MARRGLHVRAVLACFLAIINHGGLAKSIAKCCKIKMQIRSNLDFTRDGTVMVGSI